jgi:hypothetical protein
LAVAAGARFPDLRDDWPLLRDALGRLGITASTQVWSDPGVRWGEFDMVLANGAWDNIHVPDQFLGWAEETAEVTPLANTPAALRWGMDKHYLNILAASEVATVPTVWLSPDEAPSGESVALPDGEFVVKPTISGGGFQTGRYGASAADRAAAQDHIAQLLATGRSVMVQPYMEQVDVDGERGLIFMAGQFSHAFRKGPLLQPGGGAEGDLWQFENITLIEPTAAQLETAREVLGIAEEILGPTTYARVDLVPLADGTPAVLELELVDPSLYLEIEPTAPDRFARVVADQLESGRT